MLSPGIPPTEETLKALYAMGYKLYDGGKYSEAIEVFKFLSMLDLEDKKIWMGLGASYQMIKDYEKALQAYAAAAVIDESDPFTHFHAAECFLGNDQKKEANEALKSAKQLALRCPEKYNQLINRIELLEGV